MKVPSQVTLDKYGLNLDEWVAMYDKHDGCCWVCGKEQSEDARAMNVDHEHVKGWKAMPASERKKYVRGLLCYMCNRFRLTRGTTLETARNMVKYLERYEKLLKE